MVAFDAHDVLPALFTVADVLRQVVKQLLERELRRSARRVYIEQFTMYRTTITLSFMSTHIVSWSVVS